MRFKVVFILLIALLFSTSLFAQSRYLDDGISGSSFSVDSVINDSGLTTLGFTAGYSIGGIMDFGVIFNTESVSIDSHDSTDLNFSLLYNFIVIKQNENNPINVELNGSYGYTNTTSDYLDSYNRRRDAQGFIFGASMFHEFFKSSIIGILIGGEIKYKNYIIQTLDYDDPDSPSTASTYRDETIKYGGIAGISFKPLEWPIFNLELSVYHDQSTDGIDFKPSFSIINRYY